MPRKTKAAPRKPKLTRRVPFRRLSPAKKLAPNTMRNRPSMIENVAQNPKCPRTSRAPANNKRNPIATPALLQVLATGQNLALRKPGVKRKETIGYTTKSKLASTSDWGCNPGNSSNLSGSKCARHVPGPAGPSDALRPVEQNEGKRQQDKYGGVNRKRGQKLFPRFRPVLLERKPHGECYCGGNEL